MEDNKTTYKIPLFDGRNFSNWKYRVGILLDEKDLKNFIEEKLDDILAKTDDAKKAEVRKNEKKCVSILVQTIHDCQLENVKDKSTAKEMFDTLESLFVRKTIASQLFLRKQLLTMKYNDNEDISSHILKFDTKIRELKATGTKLEETDVIVHLLLTLPESYNNLVTALETMDQKNLTVEFVKTRLMDEHNKRKGVCSSYSSVSSSAMQARTDIICYKCGKSGHVMARCRNTEAASGRLTNNTEEEKRKEEAHSAMYYEDEMILVAVTDVWDDVEPNEVTGNQKLCTEVNSRINNNEYYKNLFDLEEENEFSLEAEDGTIDDRYVDLFEDRFNDHNSFRETEHGMDHLKSFQPKFDDQEENKRGRTNKKQGEVDISSGWSRSDKRIEPEVISINFGHSADNFWKVKQQNLVIGRNVLFDKSRFRGGSANLEI